MSASTRSPASAPSPPRPVDPETTTNTTKAPSVHPRKHTLVRRYLRHFGLFKRPASSPKAKHYGARTFLHSVGFALEGLWFAFQQERNFRIDILLTVATIVAGCVFQIKLQEWLVVIMMAGFVLFVELANTTVEWLVDLLTNGQFDLRAKRIKDLAAGACLVVATVCFGSIGVVFLPYVIKLFK